MFLTRKHLSRRTLLKGVGVSLGLPLLDAMIPAHTAFAQTAAKPSQRLGFGLSGADSQSESSSAASESTAVSFIAAADAATVRAVRLAVRRLYTQAYPGPATRAAGMPAVMPSRMVFM